MTGMAFLLLAAAVFVLVLALSMRIMGSGRKGFEDPRERALAALNERYARGEISRDEYLEKRAFLE